MARTSRASPGLLGRSRQTVTPMSAPVTGVAGGRLTAAGLLDAGRLFKSVVSQSWRVRLSESPACWVAASAMTRNGRTKFLVMIEWNHMSEDIADTRQNRDPVGLIMFDVHLRNSILLEKSHDFTGLFGVSDGSAVFRIGPSFESLQLRDRCFRPNHPELLYTFFFVEYEETTLRDVELLVLLESSRTERV